MCVTWRIKYVSSKVTYNNIGGWEMHIAFFDGGVDIDHIGVDFVRPEIIVT